MRGRQRRLKISQTRIPGERTDAREQLERRWYGQLSRADGLAEAVTAGGCKREPFHRWIVLRHSFSPELVRLFLDEVATDSGPILDPFAGTGTTPVECARRGVPAIGIATTPAPAFIVSTMTSPPWQNPPIIDDDDPVVAANRLTCPLDRAALLCAVAARHSSEGRLRKDAPPLRSVFTQTVEMMVQDMDQPIRQPPLMLTGDAGQLGFLDDASIGGILTSPPDLSRRRGPKLTEPIDNLYRHWWPTPETQPGQPVEVPGRSSASDNESVREACDTLASVGDRRTARTVEQYFSAMFAALAEFRRVLKDGAACWLVVGGARLADVYVPADTIVADAATKLGFEIVAMHVARRLIRVGRRFGRLTNVAPRETIICLRRR